MDQIKEAIEKSLSPGSVSFEQALFKLYADGKITKEEALRNSDSATNLSWIMNNAEQAAARVGAKVRSGPILRRFFFRRLQDRHQRRELALTRAASSRLRHRLASRLPHRAAGKVAAVRGA